MSFFKNLFSKPTEPSDNMKDGVLERATDAAHKTIIAGYREIARQTDLAPTSKTSDAEIITLYGKVLSAFHAASVERNERIPAGIKNAIALYFFQIKEKNPQEFLEEHLQYEIQWYRQNGLRDSYKREINLIKILGLEEEGR